MIKQLASKDIRSYLMAEPNSVLLDVRYKRRMGHDWQTGWRENRVKNLFFVNTIW